VAVYVVVRNVGFRYLPADATTSILVALNDKLEKADLRKVVLKKQITPQRARCRLKGRWISDQR
jgi:hypothetical protein